MKEVENVSRKFSSDVSATSIKIEYRATYGADGAPVSIFGTMKKAAQTVGYVGYEAPADRLHITFQPFGATTLRERKAAASKAHSDIDELLNAE